MGFLREARRLLQPRMSLNWILGRYRADGFVWHVRGSEYSVRHEDWLRREALHEGGELFVDIGANIGTWALRASRTFEQVIAFEPDPAANKLLRINIAQNKLRNVRVSATALSNRNTTATFQIVNPRNPKNGKLYRVPMITLDSLNVNPSLVKIDTEGSEALILRGARKSLGQRPGLVVETHSQESLLECRELLASYSYSIREITRLNRRGQRQTWLLGR